MKSLLLCFLALISLLLSSVGMSPAQWYPQHSGTTKTLNAVTFPDASNGFAVGDSGIILHTSDAGASWEEQVSGTSANLYEVCFIDANTGFAVGDSGTILKTDNGGSGWSLLSTGKEYSLNGVCFVDAETGWAVGDHWYWSPTSSDYSSIILRTTNGGVYWTQQTFTDTSQLNDVYFSDVNSGWAVGWRGYPNYEGIILRTTNGGADWTHQTSGTNRVLYDVEFIDANIGWVVGGAIGPLPRAKISHPADDGPGIVLKTVDGGLTWKTQMDTLHEALFGVSFVDSSFGCAAGFSLGSMGSGVVWGTIIRTTDGGVNWTSQMNENLVWCYDVEFIDANTGWVVGDDVDWDGLGDYIHTGMILHTTNGGVTAVDEGHPVSVPTEFALAQNYPNPFNPSTTIRYELPASTEVTITVHDLLGREVAVLVSEAKAPGEYEARFDASGLASGVYVYRLSAGKHVASRTMLLMK